MTRSGPGDRQPLIDELSGGQPAKKSLTDPLIASVMNDSKVLPRLRSDAAALAALGLTLCRFDGPRDPEKDSQDRFNEEVNKLINKTLTAAEGRHLKELGQKFVTGNWFGLAQAMRSLPKDSRDAILTEFGKIVENNINEKAGSGQICVRVNGDKLIFSGKDVYGEKGKIVFNSKDNSIDITDLADKSLGLKDDALAKPIKEFREMIRDRMAAKLEDKGEEKKDVPKEKEKEPDAATKECRTVVEAQLKLLYPRNEAFQKQALAVFDAKAKDNPKVLNDVQAQFDKAKAVDPKLAEIQRAESLLNLTNAWLIGERKLKRGDKHPVLTSEQTAYKEFPDRKGKADDALDKQIRRARALVQGEIDGTLKKDEPEELRKLRAGKKELYETKDDTASDLGVKPHIPQSRGKEATAAVRLVELSLKTKDRGGPGLNKDEQIEYDALEKFRGNDEPSKLARAAYIKKANKGFADETEKDTLVKKLNQYVEQRNKGKTEADLKELIAEIKKITD